MDIEYNKSTYSLYKLRTDLVRFIVCHSVGYLLTQLCVLILLLLQTLINPTNTKTYTGSRLKS